MLVPRAVFDPASFWPYATAPCVFDARAGLLLEPDYDVVWKWPEHENGQIHVRTNNLGLLEVEPTERTKHGLRILVAGDSHLVSVDAQESFPNVLEAQLRAEGYRDCEVLNSGIGYTFPHLYARRLEHFLDLALDVFVAALYTGNDFMEELTFAYDLQASPHPGLDPDYVARLERCRERWQGALFQGLNQAHLFKRWPGTDELALQCLLSALDEARALCDQHGILFVCVVLPSKFDVDEDLAEERPAMLAGMELDANEAALGWRLMQRVVAALGERGVPCVDPSADMRASPLPFFWRQDHHLAVSGHAFVAAALHDGLAPLLAARGLQPAR